MADRTWTYMVSYKIPRAAVDGGWTLAVQGGEEVIWPTPLTEADWPAVGARIAQQCGRACVVTSVREIDSED